MTTNGPKPRLMKPCIDIVLATYNGERFLTEQIESIQLSSRYRQLVARFIIVDDGSTDSSNTLIQRLQQKDSRIEWHQNPGPHHGPLANFNYGLTLTSSEFVMLSDQDDVWHHDKIELSYQAIKEKSGPALLFTDKRIVDEALNELCPSFFQLRNISRQWHHCAESLLQQNTASGCTMMFNRSLLSLALPIPSQAFMHDWWLILVARLKGEVVFLDQPLIDYRQHSSNSIGARSHSVRYLICHFFPHLNKFKANFWRSVRQAESLNERYQNTEVADCAYARLQQQSYLQRLVWFCRGKVRQHNWKGQLALLLTLLTTTKSQF